MKKNQSGFASTGGPQLFRNTLNQNLTNNQTYSYAHIPMKKDVPQWNTSSSVLRHSVSLYTIPKDSRFKQPKVNYHSDLKLQNKSTLGNRATTFGYGRKVEIPEVFRHNYNTEGINTPFYEIDDMILRRSKSASIKKGKTIGVNWQSYATARAPHRSTVHCPQQTRQNPGMKYIISKETGSQAQKNQIHKRLMMFTDIRGHQTLNEPGPQNYKLNQKQINRNTYQPNFGIGSKSDFTKNNQFAAVPGPIYNISGFCDKFMTQKIKNLGRSWK